MSAIEESPVPSSAVGQPLTLKEVTELLVRHYGLHEGNYNLSMEFRIGTGTFGPDQEERYPGAFFTIVKIGLTKADEPNQNTIDAAEVNPKRKAGKK